MTARPVAPAGGAAAAVLAIDGGNSKTDVALVAADGTMLASVRGGGSNHQGIGIEAMTQVLTALVREAAEAAGLPAGGPVATHTSACLAGADLPVEEADLGRLVQSMGWSATSSVVNDTFAVLRGGPRRPGPGTGASASSAARASTASGWRRTGATRGSSRSAAQRRLGRRRRTQPEALWLAIRAEDGRGPETELRPAVAAHFGLSRVEDVVVGLHLGKIDYAGLHGLVPLLFAVAGQGDQVARDVVLRQAAEMCVMVTVAAGGSGCWPPARCRSCSAAA